MTETDRDAFGLAPISPQAGDPGSGSGAGVGRATENHDPAACRTFGQFVQILEDGEFHQDLSDQLREIAARLQDFAREFGGKPGARLDIKIEFKLDGGVFEIKAKHKTTLPEHPRPKSIVWCGPDNAFTPHNPRQMQLFGVRKVNPARDVRDV